MIEMTPGSSKGGVSIQYDGNLLHYYYRQRSLCTIECKQWFNNICVKYKLGPIREDARTRGRGASSDSYDKLPPSLVFLIDAICLKLNNPSHFKTIISNRNADASDPSLCLVQRNS